MFEKSFTSAEAAEVAKELGIDWKRVKFSLEEFRRGMNTELEHGLHDPDTNITNDDPLLTGKIAWAHLKEVPNYYDRLAHMEEEG